MTSEQDKITNELQQNNHVANNRVFHSEEHQLPLTSEQKEALKRQETRTVSSFRTNKFDKESQKHWDIFYKRNETRFFKDRHWTTREFRELCSTSKNEGETHKKTLVEIGCGVGNFAFPLLEDKNCDLFIYVCDFSPRAIAFVKNHELYDENRIGKLRNKVYFLLLYMSSTIGIFTLDLMRYLKIIFGRTIINRNS